MSPSLTLTLLHCLACLAVTILNAFGEFCILNSFQHVLMFSISSAAVSVSISTLCMSVSAFNQSTWLPQPSGSSECCLAASVGESGGLAFFQGILTVCVSFAVIIVTIWMFGTYLPAQSCCVLEGETALFDCVCTPPQVICGNHHPGDVPAEGDKSDGERDVPVFGVGAEC